MEKIISLELAKQIKSQGFKKPTRYFYQDEDLSYSPKGLKKVKEQKRRINHNKYDAFIYSAPSENEYLKWKQDVERDLKRNNL